MNEIDKCRILKWSNIIGVEGEDVFTFSGIVRKFDDRTEFKNI